MKCVIITVGKEKGGDFDEAIRSFSGRILRYLPLEWMYVSNLSTKEKESEKMLSLLKKDDYVVLLDERGSDMRSQALAELVENRMVDGARRIVFIIGGAYGVSGSVYNRANYVWKISSLTLPHMLVRALLAEQIYRACTILKGEPYHHA